MTEPRWNNTPLSWSPIAMPTVSPRSFMRIGSDAVLPGKTPRSRTVYVGVNARASEGRRRAAAVKLLRNFTDLFQMPSFARRIKIFIDIRDLRRTIGRDKPYPSVI